MAVTAVSTLYPPKLPTFAPAFISTASPKIYYELSPYMSAGEARRVHVSLVNQDTNDTALAEATGIYITEGLEYDPDKGSYFVTIPVDKVLNATGTTGWLTNCYYKLQLRLDSYNGGVVDNNSNYFIANTQYFSEWSTVCLLRAIDEPELLLNNFDTTSGTDTLAFNRGIVPISGQLYFGNSVVPTEKDQVQSFRIQVLPKSPDEYPVYIDSGEIFTGDQINPNSLNYNLDLAALSDTDEVKDYRIRVYYLTRNLFQGHKDYKITIEDYVSDDSFNPTVTLNLNDETGTVQLHIENWMSVFGTLYVRRSSSKSNFKNWEMIREQVIAGPIDLTIYDNTIQSGVWYRYIIQFANIRGGITPIVYSAKFIPNFFGPFLSRGNKQIHLQYNYTISNMKPNVNRQKIDVIGGKYPKFAENAIMNYKSFSITGMISAQEDEFKTFLNQKDYFGEEYGNYNVYLEQNGVIDPDYNQLWEREFREELTNWLNDGEPKLYRSQPEGNVVVMLHDVTLTPIASMSRRLWNFSATMTEIAESDSLTKLDELGIYDCVTLADKNHVTIGPGGEDEPIPEYVNVTTLGQIYQKGITDMVTGNVDIINNYLMPNLQTEYSGILASRYPTDGYISNVKIQFHSKPHLFIQKNPTSPLQLVERVESLSEDERKKLRLGYCFEVNNQFSSPNASSMFFVNEKGYYQIPKNIDVTSLFFPQEDDIVTVDYLFHYKERNDQSTIITGSSVEKTLVSQDNRTYKPGEWMGASIRRRHTYLIPGNFFQRMEWWRGISIDTAPYAVFEVLYEGAELGEQVQLETGFSGNLNLLKTVPAIDIRFMGRRMHKVGFERQPYAEDWEYCEDISGVDYANAADIKKPLPRVLYTIGGKKYLYYINHQFYEIEREDNDLILAKVPVDGLLNYYGSVIRDSYV